VVKDLIRARLDAGADIRFEVGRHRIEGLRQPRRPRSVSATRATAGAIACDWIAGCDGSHGAQPRRSIRQGP
jgi:p-hydroxybenzoate 3-monooxygenase